MPSLSLMVSADSHVLEPPDLWTKRLVAPYRRMAPRLVESAQRGIFFIGPGIGLSMNDASSPAGRKVQRVGLSDLVPGGSDVRARLDDCDTDGVAAEILYPSAALMLFGATDGDYRRACMSVYNNWLAELCHQAPRRLFGLGLLDVEDPAWAVEELGRGQDLGFVGALIPGRPPTGPYGEPRFDCLWRFASERRLPLSLHAFTDRYPADTLGSGLPAVAAMGPIVGAQRALALLAVSGVLARFPELRVVLSEFDAGWAPHFCQRLDLMAELRGTPAAAEALTQPPSAYIRRQVSFGFQQDSTAIDLRARLGVHALLWGSDYPHLASYWPHSRSMLETMLAGVPENESDAIVGGNAIALYRLAERLDGGGRRTSSVNATV